MEYDNIGENNVIARIECAGVITYVIGLISKIGDNAFRVPNWKSQS